MRADAEVPLRTLLHVCECYVGGVRTHLGLLLPALRTQGFRIVAALATRRDDHAESGARALEVQGIEVHRLELSRGFAPYEDRRARGALAAVARASGARIVHSHGAKAGFLARTARYDAPVARVHTAHGFAHRKRREFGAWKRAIFRALERHLVARTERLIAVSDAEAGEARALGHAPAHVCVIRNAVRVPARAELRSRERARAELGVARSGLHALVAGILMPEKGQELVLRALAEPGAEAWTAWFAGDGGELAKLEALAARLGLRERARFLGHVSEIGPWIDACDLALLPSHSEGMPYVALEALARERPLLGCAVGGLREIWSAEDQSFAAERGVSLLLDSRDPREWAGALAAWAAHAAAREELGARGRTRAASSFGIEAQIDAHVALYEELGATRATSATSRTIGTNGRDRA